MPQLVACRWVGGRWPHVGGGVKVGDEIVKVEVGWVP